MRTFAPVLVLALCALACESAPPSSQPEAEPQRPQASSRSARGLDWKALADTALAETGRAGAVVVLDVDSRAVLASVERSGINLHPATTLVNPGSVVKPLLALAALHEEIISTEETIPCAGAREIEGATFTCFAEHGEIALLEGLWTSCNHYAFALAERLGEASVTTHYERFGLSSRGPRGHVASMATGHAQLAASPLQLAQAYADLARPPAGWPYAEAALETVHEGLRKVVSEAEGTGRRAGLEALTVAGKTGTADMEIGDQPVRLNWFAGWAPAEDPQVVVVVQIEGEGTGGELAAPVARALFAALTRG